MSIVLPVHKKNPKELNVCQSQWSLLTTLHTTPSCVAVLINVAAIWQQRSKEIEKPINA
jgi:hypothetical protein